MELISHHLCPFLHRTIILLEKKGLKKNIDFKVTRVPIYDLPPRLFELSPKGSMPVLVNDSGKVLLRSLVMNSMFDETIQPSFLPADAFERAQHRAIIIDCGDLLDLMRMVYTAKDELALNTNLDKLFNGLKSVSPQLESLMGNVGKLENGMVESAFAGLFTVMLNFDKIKNDTRWNEMPKIRAYADKLVADPIVLEAKSEDYNGEFGRFFNHFNSAFSQWI